MAYRRRTISDKNGKTLGWITVENDGKQVLYGRGRKLATFNPETNQTRETRKRRQYWTGNTLEQLVSKLLYPGWNPPEMFEEKKSK